MSLAQNAKKSKVLLIGLHGGITPILGNAAAFPNLGWMQGRTAAVNNEVSWDSQLFSSLMQTASPYFGVAGSMGTGSHDGAKLFWYENNQIQKCFPVMLADAIGGNSTLKVAGVGPDRIPEQRYNQVTDLASYLELVGDTVSQPGAGAPPPNYQRDSDIMKKIQEMGSGLIKNNELALNDLAGGVNAFSESAAQIAANPPTAETAAPVVVNPNAIMADYGITSTQIGGDFNSKMAAAEVLLRTGVNVVTVVDAGGTSKWDTHDDNNGSRARGLYQNILGGLETFCRRMLGTEEYNVTIAFLSEHSRIVEKSNHGPHTAIPIFSDSIIGGRSTGQTDAGGFVQAPQPAQNFRALVADLAGVGANPFGNHQHQKLYTP